jgi:transposase
MASLQRVRARGRSYWRIVESRRINGKPRAIPILHLGTTDQLLNRLLSAPEGQLHIHSYQHGDVAAFKAMADRLDLVSLIDRHVQTSRRSLSIGTTLLLAAINRAIKPRSKRGFAAWAKTTSIPHLFGIQVDQLTSQYFWDQMDLLDEPALEAIEDDLTRKVVTLFHLKLDTLFYDTTNFFTYLASDNDRCELAQRGHSQQRRSDLRQFNLALLVCQDGQIPLCSQVYKGNTVDSTRFPDSLTQIRQRLEGLVGQLEDLTLIYDKGNNSKKNQAWVDATPLHYVASLVPTQHPELMAIASTQYDPLGPGPLEGLPVYRCQRQIWGTERTVVLFISQELKTGQIRGVNQQLNKRLKALLAWKQRLSKPRSGPRTPKRGHQQAEALQRGQYIQDILKVSYHPRRKGVNRLSWSIDEAARDHLYKEVFGKRILMSDQHHWSTEEIILAYQGQSRAEAAFRELKDPTHLAVRPRYHWTDQKVRVHTFICLVALLLSRLIEREARQAGYRGSLSGLLDQLASIRLAMVLQPAREEGDRPRCEWTLEDSQEPVQRIFQRLVPQRAPFMFTPLSA